MAEDGEVAIGIDLGTTNSAAATMVNGQPQIIGRRSGDMPLLPSMVGYTPGGDRVVGQAAWLLAEAFPENVAYAVKRFIGRRWTAELAEAARGYLPFPLVEGPAGDVRVKVAGRTLPVSQVAAMVLTELRLDAEHYFDREVTQAVITVPASFNDAQRQATKEAADLAGLSVLRLLNEPTAAASAYGLSTGFEGRALVFDLGAGTFDVSILEMRKGEFETIATGGDPFLGGEDFDHSIVQWLLAQYSEEDRKRVMGHTLSMQRLKIVAEQAKKNVSTDLETPVLVSVLPDARGEGVPLETTLTRAFFEQIAKAPIDRCLEAVGQTLSEASIAPDTIDAILLVGGMSRAPVIRNRVREFFGGKDPVPGVDPDLVVALGAAIHADEVLHGGGRVKVIDVNSSTLGVRIAGGGFRPLIAKNAALPAEVKEVYHPAQGGQTVVRIPIMQGESQRADKNNLLGEVTLQGLRAAARGDVSIEVTFHMGADGVLSVEARDMETGRAEKVEILATTALDEDERKQMAAEELAQRADQLAVPSSGL